MTNPIEQEIQGKGKTAPRITPNHIEGVITSEHYFTAADGVDGRFATQTQRYPDDNAGQPELCLLTFCVLVLRNGFTVTGESACASPENFDEEIVRKIARQNAVQKIWALEGYLLKQHLFISSGPSEDDQWQHFLSYTGYHSEPKEVQEKLRKAFFDGSYALQWREE